MIFLLLFVRVLLSRYATEFTQVHTINQARKVEKCFFPPKTINYLKSTIIQAISKQRLKKTPKQNTYFYKNINKCTVIQMKLFSCNINSLYVNYTMFTLNFNSLQLFIDIYT
ncbi:hypothetical protein MS3_00000109 [Schistosoma haematobium]|uniref:Secreted protein n=1 Tax=Schistosoma haematobium TaxID=6185 RepID=A0A922LKP7_SCHHA|nr:hypothetical protein MS3_00000109 [Schistosoma haematobium]KAH9588042.1 hypothetical protein MS3_00000109 [Schistosoma haematobium]